VSAIKTKDIRSALLKKGFRSDNRHHEYLWLYVGERQTGVMTRLSHGRSEYGEDLLAKVKKQLGVSKEQLFALVGCPLNYETYVAHLVETGRIKTE
jgi:hypothetical protein